MGESKSILQATFEKAQQKHPALSRQVLWLGLCVAIALGAGLGVLARARIPQSLAITGYSGQLGEWELTATVARDSNTGDRELSGPVTMTHVGLCSVDGPERKAGQMRVRMSRLSAHIEARLLVDGVECTFSGPMSATRIGMLLCPDRRPVPLTLWVK